MPPRKNERVHPFGQIGQNLNLGGDLGATGNRHHGASGVLERPVERRDLGHHQEPRIGWQKMRDALDRGMCPM